MLDTVPSVTAHARLALLAELYREQIEQYPCVYLTEHATPGTLAHHVNIFEWYLPYLHGRRVILDWGSAHGPDSCLLRQQFGDAIELHACDFSSEAAYRVFREAARPLYKQLTDPLRLPYEDNTFDAVIGSGVLEHTAMEGESLKELYRVLQPQGVLVITYLPYAYSWDEWRRRVKKVNYHRRLFSQRAFARTLLSHGFEAQAIHFQGRLPNKLSPGHSFLRRLLKPFLGSLWEPLVRPIRYPFFSQSVLCGIARKMHVM